MKRVVVTAMALALGAGSAGAAGSTGGSSGVALAALVGAHSPLLSNAAKHTLAAMLGGTHFSSSGPIIVKAASVSCRSSDVDLTLHDCTLKFGAATRTFHGREAHELYATLIENGVASDGAAGSIFEALSHLDCTIKPAEVKQKSGGGSACSFSPGP